MALNLEDQENPIDPRKPDLRPVLSKLQGNILKSHGRDYAMHSFFRFTGDRTKSRELIHRLSKLVTSATEQEAQTARYKADQPEEIFGALMLSAKGLTHLGCYLPDGFGEATMQPAAEPAVSFAEPMKAAAAALGDEPDSWDAGYKGADIDGLLILAMGKEKGVFDADAIPTALLDAVKNAHGQMGGSAEVAALEIGQQQRRGEEAVEHFGYVDGISQPIMTVPDLPPANQRQHNDPSAGPGLALVRDPFVGDGNACGSFFVFRKLEQNVKAWREQEEALSEALGGIGEDLAGALLVGRFEDGTPVVLSSKPSGAKPENDFTYATDAALPDAFPAKCPFHAHIRKTNPRGDIARQFKLGAEADRDERRRRVVRRGITYGSRDNDMKDSPAGGVGLLFQCYQRSIPDQFAFMQSSWANDPGFVRPGGTGQDSVIGQGSRGTEGTWPTPWGSKNTKELSDVQQTVHSRGGEFFWTPSMPFFASLVGKG